MSQGFSSEPEPSDLPFISAEGGGESASVSREVQDRFAVILEQILSASEDGSATPLNDGQSELAAVACRYSTLDFCVDPVLIELIQVVTRRMKGLSDRRLHAMERAIAASLSDDQVSLGRLQKLWDHLKRAVSNG